MSIEVLKTQTNYRAVAEFYSEYNADKYLVSELIVE